MSESKIGLIVNPIAGMGGKVGLKGTDGPEILEKARELGSEPVAPERAVKALREVSRSGIDIEILTCSGDMGENESKEVGLDFRVIEVVGSGDTAPEDTKRAAESILTEEAEIIMFAGGDGTARDMIDAVDMNVPLMGIPTGVKMHSAVFANTPEIAGKLIVRYLRRDLPLREAEVMDVDEEAFRHNELDTDLKGYAKTPYDPRWVQAAKSPTVSTGSEKGDQKSIARWIVEQMEEDRLYILGPGTTTRSVAEELDIQNSTLLGVDLVKDGKLLAKDVVESRIIKEVEKGPATVVVSPIGKQGFILGRGNQQVSPEVVRKIGPDNLMIIATPNKLSETPRLKVDTGDPDLDEEFRGYMRVVIGYGIERPVPVA